MLNIGCQNLQEMTSRMDSVTTLNANHKVDVTLHIEKYLDGQ